MTQVFKIISSASQDRLEKLILERLLPGAAKKDIDQRIWNLFGEVWAVMFTDLSGFSRHVAEFGIIHFLQIIIESQRLFVPIIEAHDGILLKVEGDSMLVIFRNPESALKCSIEMQKSTAEYNHLKDEAEKIFLCVGLGYGNILKIGDQDIFGNEVNAASKLGEDIAGPSEILVTESVKKAIQNCPDLEFTLLSEIPPGAKAAFKLSYKF